MKVSPGFGTKFVSMLKRGKALIASEDDGSAIV
jgi:hypothetical protein